MSFSDYQKVLTHIIMLNLTALDFLHMRFIKSIKFYIAKKMATLLSQLYTGWSNFLYSTRVQNSKTKFLKLRVYWTPHLENYLA